MTDKIYIHRPNAFGEAFSSAGVIATTKGPLHILNLPQKRIPRVSYPLKIHNN